MALTVNTVPRYKGLSGGGHQQVQNAAITDNGTTIALGRQTTIAGNATLTGGNVVMATAAKGLVLKQGANGRVGTFVANGITQVDIASTAIAITDCIVISLNTIGGTVGALPQIISITGSTGFSVVCTALDTSTYNWCAIGNQA